MLTGSLGLDDKFDNLKTSMHTELEIMSYDLNLSFTELHAFAVDARFFTQ